MKKRIFDIGLSLLALLILAPIFVLIALQVRCKMGTLVLFHQTRPGLHGRLFTILKFRTMTDERGTEGNLLPDEQRLTGFGKFLRSTSLDELPTLFNVLKGEMSLVGPRPLLMEYLPLYSKEQSRRHEVKPGITGWAQVNGRNAISWEDKFMLDVWYVENRSFWLDIKILWLTILKVLSLENITAPGHATSPKFTNKRK